MKSVYKRVAGEQMRGLFTIGLAATLLASCNKEEPTICDLMCEELVLNCDVGAFPSLESCVNGCLYNQEEKGYDIPGQAQCVIEAECDTFEIVECEHEYGEQRGGD